MLDARRQTHIPSNILALQKKPIAVQFGSTLLKCYRKLRDHETTTRMYSTASNKNLGVMALALFFMVLVSVPVVDSFVDHACAAGCRTAPISNTNAIIVLQASEVSRTGEPQQDPSMFFDRRSLLVAGAISLTAGYAAKQKTVPTASTVVPLESSTVKTILSPAMTTASSVDQALSMIESIGDKRFLHAIVASDYRFLYQDEQPLDLSDTTIESIFSKKVPSHENGSRSVMMAASGSLASTKAVSVWPLETPVCTSASCNSIHYAWPEEEGSIPKSNNRKLIVDGIDCGKMALEDALEGDIQVLVQAPSMLLVPKSMESQLRKGLRDAFLI